MTKNCQNCGSKLTRQVYWGTEFWYHGDALTGLFAVCPKLQAQPKPAEQVA
jgi:hypothetical protein